MRKVKFKCCEPPNGYVEYEGVFHQWGLVAYEDADGFSSASIGICELPDGSIKTPSPIDIQFLPTETVEKQMD